MLKKGTFGAFCFGFWYVNEHFERTEAPPSPKWFQEPKRRLILRNYLAPFWDTFFDFSQSVGNAKNV